MATTPAFTIRPATADDAEHIYRFIMDLAIYEKAPNEVANTPEMIREVIFGPESTVKAILCEAEVDVNAVEGASSSGSHGKSAEKKATKKEVRPIGFAVYFFNYSTWTGRHGLYLEDLYVDPSQRGAGAGKGILKYLAKEAVARGCGRMEWVCLNWNEPAIAFYKSLGAVGMTEWTTWRLTGDALRSFGEAN